MPVCPLTSDEIAPIAHQFCGKNACHDHAFFVLRRTGNFSSARRRKSIFAFDITAPGGADESVERGWLFGERLENGVRCVAVKFNADLRPNFVREIDQLASTRDRHE